MVVKSKGKLYKIPLNSGLGLGIMVICPDKRGAFNKIMKQQHGGNCRIVFEMMM